MAFRRVSVLMTVAAALLGGFTPGRAQEVEEVRKTVEALFDAMRAKDGELLRKVTTPEARLVNTRTVEGAPRMGSTAIEDFIRRVVESEAHLDERIWDVEVRVNENLASVWNRYNFYLDGELHHCGVDAFQLFRSLDGWKIFHIADTYSEEGCQPNSPR
jgi:ketosteroid isomerase-like protein